MKLTYLIGQGQVLAVSEVLDGHLNTHQGCSYSQRHCPAGKYQLVVRCRCNPVPVENVAVPQVAAGAPGQDHVGIANLGREMEDREIVESFDSRSRKVEKPRNCYSLDIPVILN